MKCLMNKKEFWKTISGICNSFLTVKDKRFSTQFPNNKKQKTVMWTDTKIFVQCPHLSLSIRRTE